MLKREFNEVLKQALYFIIFVICVPFIPMIVSRYIDSSMSYTSAMLMVYQVGLFIWIIITGLSMFSSERRQEALEYMLTFPFSRLRLLWLKILPRITILTLFCLLLYLLRELLAGGIRSDMLLILPPAQIFYLLFMLFFVSLSLSVIHENFILQVLVTLFLVFSHWILLLFFVRRYADKLLGTRGFFYNVSITSFSIFSLLSLVIPLVVSFVIAFKKYDISPSRHFRKRYLKMFIPMIVIGLLASMLYAYTIKPEVYTHYMLLEDHSLVEVTDRFNSLKLYDEESVQKFDLSGYDSFYMAREDKGYLYLMAYHYMHKKETTLLRLNLKNHEMETLYVEKNRYSSEVFHFRIYRNKIVIADKYAEALILTDIDTKKTTRVKLDKKILGDYGSFSLFAVDESEGQRSWLIRTEYFNCVKVFKVWENGTFMQLGGEYEKHCHPAYVNNVFIARVGSDLVFSKLTPEGLEEIKRLPGIPSIRFFLSSWFRRDLETESMKVASAVWYDAGAISGKLYTIDMKTLEISDEIDFKGILRIANDGTFYTYEDFTNLGKIHRIKDGKLELVKTFSDLDKVFRDTISGAGIVVRKKGKIMVYAYPDFKELHYRALN